MLLMRNSVRSEEADDLLNESIPCGPHTHIGTVFNDLYERSRNGYHGEGKEGLRHGEGTMKFNSGNKYVGQFKANEFCGQGCLTLKDGTVYHEGIFPHNKPKNRRRSLI